MTAPVIEPATAPTERPDGTASVRLVLAVEGMDTSDGRYLEPGSLTTRPMPLTLWVQPKNTHGIDGDAATWVAGAITKAWRVDGPTITQRSTGEPFPEGTYVWLGEGWMYTDVPGPQYGGKPAYQMVKDGALYGNSVDLTAVDWALEADPSSGDDRVTTYAAAISSTTIVGLPAFMDSFIELDGDMIDPAPEALAASAAAIAEGYAVPSWRSPEVGDLCGPCAAHPDAAPDELTAADLIAQEHPYATTLLEGADLEPAALDFSTSGMIALIPTEPERLAVDGGDPANDLHVTLVYLGDEVTTWEPEMIAAVHQSARELVNHDALCERINRDAAERNEDPIDCEQLYRSPLQDGPIRAGIFAHAVFNPAGEEPATVYLLDGSGDRAAIDQAHQELCNTVSYQVGDVNFPEQHKPYVPHITAGYNLDPSALNYTGPVTFGWLRVAIGNQRTDYPLGGGSPIVASGTALPPAEWFADPQLDGPTPITVTDDGRVYGHLACWGTCHTGFTGQCRTAPSSPSNYAYFRVHSTPAAGPDGTTVHIPVGYGTLSRSTTSGGHAGLRDDALRAAEHYDNTCCAVFELAAGEDSHGIWVAGRLMPGLDEAMEHRARGAALSGDWRTIRGSLELVAALGVNVPGYPVPHTGVRVAAGTPVALVAAGLPPLPGTQFEDRRAEVDEMLAWFRSQKAAAEVAQFRAEVNDITGPFTEDGWWEIAAETLLAVEAEHPWFNADLTHYGDFSDDEPEAFTAAGGKKLHLPKYIKRIAKHLKKKGMATGHAIASAVNAAKKMCSTGDLQFPGLQHVNPGSRAEACAAVAQWKADRPGAK